VIFSSLGSISKNFGYFLLDTSTNTPISVQTGIFRTNCLDCLDRTNVIQTLLAKKIVEDFLITVGAWRGWSSTLSDEGAEGIFNGMWADNGDWLSKIYAGTGALKSAFTRRGKSTLMGFLDDAAKNVTRFYNSNFADKLRQEAIEILLGKYAASPAVILSNPLSDAVSEEMNLRKNEYSFTKKATLWIGSWNVMGGVPHTKERFEGWFGVSNGIFLYLYLLYIYFRFTWNSH